MGTKRLKYNKETNIIEVIEEEHHVVESKVVKPKQRRETVNFIIIILSFVISVGALGISYSQKVASEKQTDVSVRQFELDKKPVFESYIEQKELYNDDEYWGIYRGWLYKNGIKAFDEWYNEKYPEKNISYIGEKRRFWDAYDNGDTVTLAGLTDGEYEDYESEYRNYLYSMNYESYDRWKEFDYVFKKDCITLKNTGAYITNAKLNVYTYKNYYLKIGDDIYYSFVIDMGGYVLKEFWTGSYYTTGSYNSGNNSFYIEYTQRDQGYEDEYWELENSLGFVSTAEFLGEIIPDDTDSFLVLGESVYFSISYLDNEQEEHTEWYEYDKESNTLNYVETYDSKVEIPDITESENYNAYDEAKSLHIAQILGYQNAQWRPFFGSEDYSYVKKAKEKIISDVKALVDGM